MFLNFESSYTISHRLPVYNAFPNGNASKVHSHLSLRLMATTRAKAGLSAAPIPLILSGTTAASLGDSSRQLPRSRLRTRPPRPRSPPASALLTQPAPAWLTTFTAPARVAPLLLLCVFQVCFSINACMLSSAGQNRPAALRTLAPLGRPRGAARGGRALRCPCRLPGRPPAPHHSDRCPVSPARAGHASPRGRSLL